MLPLRLNSKMQIVGLTYIPIGIGIVAGALCHPIWARCVLLTLSSPSFFLLIPPISAFSSPSATRADVSYSMKLLPPQSNPTRPPPSSRGTPPQRPLGRLPRPRLTLLVRVHDVYERPLDCVVGALRFSLLAVEREERGVLTFATFHLAH